MILCVVGVYPVVSLERHKAESKMQATPSAISDPAITRPVATPHQNCPEPRSSVHRNARLLLSRSVEKGCWCWGRSTLSRRVGVAIQALAARGRSVLRHIPGPARSMITCRVRVEWTHLQTKRQVRCGNAIQVKRWRRVRYPCSCGGTQDLGMRLLSLDRCRL